MELGRHLGATGCIVKMSKAGDVDRPKAGRVRYNRFDKIYCGGMHP